MFIPMWIIVLLAACVLFNMNQENQGKFWFFIFCAALVGAVVFLGLYVYALSIEDGEAWDSIKQCVVFYGGIGLAAWIKEKYFPGDEEPS